MDIQLFDIGLNILTITFYIWCVRFILKVRKNGTETEKTAVMLAAVKTLLLTFGVMIFFLNLALVMYFLGLAGVLDPINLPSSAFPIRVSVAYPVIFYMFKGKLQQPKD